MFARFSSAMYAPLIAIKFVYDISCFVILSFPVSCYLTNKDEYINTISKVKRSKVNATRRITIRCTFKGLTLSSVVIRKIFVDVHQFITF